jgi:protein-L-isoaspartate(D-aspartate) O-methyltransferase
MDDSEFISLRLRMVSDQIESRGIHDARVLAALREIPRHRFVPDKLAREAYADTPLPIGLQQTISQPYIVAYMTQALRLTGQETVLEVGAGSGYQTAVLAKLARRVVTIERHPALAENAARILKSLGLENVDVRVGDGSLGWPESAPFDGIVVTAAAPGVPPPLLDQLSEESGRLVIPIGRFGDQVLELWQRQMGAFTRQVLLAVAFVPLMGRHGFDD